MQRITAAQKLRYRFDNAMARGPIALVGWLFLLSMGLVLAVTLIVVLLDIAPPGSDGHELGFLGVLWVGITSTLDSGVLSGATGTPAYVATVVVTTLGGIFLASTLIGLLTNAITEKAENLRKGRSLVVERGHTVILGWSPHVPTILSELVIANQNQKRAAIAILAERDKVEMEEEIRAKVGKTGRTRIICRSGSPIDLTDLEIVNPRSARAIIIPTPEVPDPDAYVIKTLLALTNNPNRRPEPYHIVAEIRDPDNMDVARLVGRDEARLILGHQVTAQIAAQICRQAGLSSVYTELLDFSGDEIYFQREAGLIGKTFGESLLLYEDSAILGIRFADGCIKLNPPMETVFAEGDAVIAVSEDDDRVRLNASATPQIEHDAIRSRTSQPPRPERTLILGWNPRAKTIIEELDHYAASGSAVTVVAADGDATEAMGLAATLANHTIEVVREDPSDRQVLDALEICRYDHVITLSPAQTPDPQAADARTLITLLHLRDIVSRSARAISIVSEMLDPRNRQLAEVTRADDFIVSDTLVSLMLTQVAENRELDTVFTDLFDADGSELYLKPAGDYVALGRPLSFYTVVEAARQRGEVALGYRRRSDDGAPVAPFELRVNPAKSQPVSFGCDDRVIVLAES